MKKRLFLICIFLALALTLPLLSRRSHRPDPPLPAVTPAPAAAQTLPATAAIIAPVLHHANAAVSRPTPENTAATAAKPPVQDKILQPAMAARDPDTLPGLYASSNTAAKELPDDFLEQTEATLAKEDTTLRKNEVLQEKIIDPEERKAVEAWQKQEIKRREDVQEKNFAEYATALENQVVGAWKTGKVATVTFFKDGTGETRSLKEESKEETLLSNFYFRYTMNNNILKIIPILTAGSKRRITCHFVVKKTGQELLIGPYRYRAQ
ncbi:MAG: hypothetical protein V1913_04535 [Fibrobacterota bacterium]